MLRVSLVTSLLLVSFSAVACRSSLGLSDLKFEERPTKILERPEPPGEGGSGGIVLHHFESFPLQIPSRFEVFPSTLGPSFARFYLYDAETGDLERYFGADEQLSSGKLAFLPDQTFVADSVVGGTSTLFGYERETGLVSLVDDLKSDAPLDIRTSAGSPGYTSLIAYEWSNFPEPKLFVHNENTGSFRFVPMPGNESDSSDPVVGSLPLKDVDFSAWPDPTTPRVLAFDRAKNEVSLWTLGETSTRVASVVLASPTTHAFAVLDANGETGLLSYDGNSGLAERFAVTIEGESFLLTSSAKVIWPTAMTDLFVVPNEKAFLVFNAETRVLTRYSFDPLQSGGPVVVK